LRTGIPGGPEDLKSAPDFPYDNLIFPQYDPVRTRGYQIGPGALPSARWSGKEVSGISPLYRRAMDDESRPGKQQMGKEEKINDE